MASKGATPDIIIGVDFGMTCTAVAYSYGPNWERPENIQQWPGLSVSDSHNKVPSALHYPPGAPITWGFACDYDNTFPIDDFKLELDPRYMPDDPNRTPVANARQWYKDYMTCLHAFLAERFDDILPRWRSQKVEWHFSVPTTWTSHNMKLEMQEVLGSCGYGKDGPGHSWMISLTEAEAAAVHAANQLYAKGDIILVCDAGGGTTDVNILRIDSHPGEPAKLTPLDHDEGKEIGSTNIDESFRIMAESRLAQIAQHLKEAPERVAKKMVRSHGARFQSAKCGFYDQRIATPPAYPLAIPDLLDPDATNFPELGIENGKLYLKREELQAFFEKEVGGVITLIKNRLMSLYAKDKTSQVTWLVRSGGLGSSPYVQARLKEVFEKGDAAPAPNATRMKIIQGSAPQTAISQGLVLARIQKVKYLKDVFMLKCAQASYGILIKEPFDQSRHFNEDIEFDNVVGQQFALNQIDWIVIRGRPVVDDSGGSGDSSGGPDGSVGRKKYVNRVAKGGENDVLTATIVTSTVAPELLPASRRRAHEARVHVEEACKIDVTMPPSQIEKKKKKWYNRKHFRECTFHLRIVPDIAEIRFKLLTKDGEECSTTDGSVNVEWGQKSADPVHPTEPKPHKVAAQPVRLD